MGRKEVMRRQFRAVATNWGRVRLQEGRRGRAPSWPEEAKGSKERTAEVMAHQGHDELIVSIDVGEDGR
jgi:hypothetical protein